eukprot:393852-Pleurochrysis_carterae.AAC.1
MLHSKDGGSAGRGLRGVAAFDGRAFSEGLHHREHSGPARDRPGDSNARGCALCPRRPRGQKSPDVRAQRDHTQ